MRIGIVGAGAVGTCCAIALQTDGHDIEIFDPLEIGRAASEGNSGIIADNEIIPLGRPEILRTLPAMLRDPNGPLAIRWRHLPTLLPWFARLVLAARPAQVEAITAKLAELLVGSAAEWRRILADTPVEHLLRRSGWLRAYPLEAGLPGAYKTAAIQRGYGIASEIVDSATIARLEPAFVKPIAGGVYYPDVYSLASPGAVLQMLLKLCVQRGGQLHREKVAVLRAESGAAVVETRDTQYRFDRVVLAAGAWSKPLAALLGPAPSLNSERGYHLMFACDGIALQRPVSLVAPGYTLAPMIEGLRLASGVEFAAVDAAPDFRRIDAMAAHARSLLPGLPSVPISRWLGRRPSMPDSLPVIRPATDAPNFILAFGHGHLGLTLGPVTGRIVAGLVRRSHSRGA